MNKLTIDEFIKRANVVHNNKYDYTKADYVNQDTKIEIICPKHGSFYQRPDHHLSGHECKKCSCFSEKNILRYDKAKKEFIEKAIMIHGNRYDYSKIKYVNAKTKIIIICPIHGEFLQTPDSHLRGSNCPQCAIDSNPMHQNSGVDEFVKSSLLVHGNKYDYSNVIYINSKTKVEIICKIHGSFYQTPTNHLSGRGCQFCVDMHNSNGEQKIINFLNKNNIKYARQKTFCDCKNPKTNHKLRFDFYLTNFNICIEYDGIQHFYPSSLMGGYNQFLKQKYRDKIKNEYCESKNIKLVRIKYNESIENKLKFLIS